MENNILRCSICNLKKNVTEFGIRKNRRKKYTSQCKQCKKYTSQKNKGKALRTKIL